MPAVPDVFPAKTPSQFRGKARSRPSTPQIVLSTSRPYLRRGVLLTEHLQKSWRVEKAICLKLETTGTSLKQNVMLLVALHLGQRLSPGLKG